MKKKKWYRLDNAALIFPAVMRRDWNNVFRLSATLKEPVDKRILDQAICDMKKRFPSFFVRLRKGFFWFYLEEIEKPIQSKEDYAYPLTHMSKTEMKNCCIRVLYYKNRIAVEFFHSVTDGTGGSIFIQNLVAQYLRIRYQIQIPESGDLVAMEAVPSGNELKDCFPLCSGKYAATRRDTNAYRLHGTPESGDFRHLITGVVPTEILHKTAKSYHATITAFLAAVMAESIQKIQDREKLQKHQKPVKITIAVNLRKLFGGIQTFRNLALMVHCGFDPRIADYDLPAICNQMTHQLASEVVPQKMRGAVAANVLPQQNPIVRIMPLPIKNLVMKLVYASVGERKGCLNISNLGQIKTPDIMLEYVERIEFIIGVQYSYPNNCSVASFGDKTCINMIRNIRESELERLFFSRLVELGIPVDIESNRYEEPYDSSNDERR